MAQHFGRRTSTVFRIAVLGLPVLVAGLFVAGGLYWRSDAAHNIGQPADQPIPFRHDLHVGGLGLDCRYCHSSVERAASAGMPSAQTCLTCHSQVWQGVTTLEPMRTSSALDLPIPWQSVHRLPEFTVFHHGAHVQSGVACETCHGRVDQMARTVKTEELSMGWCLDCHRDPESRLRPPSEVFEMGWIGEGQPPVAAPSIDPAVARRLTDCSTCHK
ncbi:MAG: cytochrome c3 family protein [Hyphomicrobiales bacterium]